MMPHNGLPLLDPRHGRCGRAKRHLVAKADCPLIGWAFVTTA